MTEEIDDDVIDARYVELCFEDARRTLEALPWSGHSTGYSQTMREVVQDIEDMQPAEGVGRAASVARHKIAIMEEVFTWLAYIPAEKKTLRRIINMRSKTHTVTGKPATWYGIGKKLGFHPDSVKLWHGQGLAIIAVELNRLNPPVPIPAPISCAIPPARRASHDTPPASQAMPSRSEA